LNLDVAWSANNQTSIAALSYLPSVGAPSLTIGQLTSRNGFNVTGPSGSYVLGIVISRYFPQPSLLASLLIGSTVTETQLVVADQLGRVVEKCINTEPNFPVINFVCNFIDAKLTVSGFVN
jgi:hypothetical protein